MSIDLGFEVSTGKRVTVPLKHTCVTGQTQESGKTTTLEALISRSGLRAVAFVTKRGEKSFRLMQPIPIFYRESEDDSYWRYVVSILEGILEIRMGWPEQALITKLCRKYDHEGTKAKKAYKWPVAKSLKQLLSNVQVLLPHVRGGQEMICIRLEENLIKVIHEIDDAKFDSKLTLSRGINVMDISKLSQELQALVIRSVIEWVHQKEHGTIVIIPEAWKFIPQGRNTPVKPAAERLIREGAGIKNFVWFDSQDLRGVDKALLRSVGLWLFGVQREKNEVANTLDSIPDLPKPSASAIMQLKIGQFYVAHGGVCLMTYVQPAGMEDLHAQAIARGEESPDSWKQIVRTLDEKETEVSSADLTRTDAAGSDGSNQLLDQEAESEDEMWKERAEKAEAEIAILVKRVAELQLLVKTNCEPIVQIHITESN